MKNTDSILKAHVSLNVKDVTKSIEFYRKLFGIEPTKIRDGYAKFDVQNPPLNLALNQNVAVGQGSLSHLGIQVASTEEVIKTKNRWKELGLKTKDEMQTNCCYALQDKTWTSDPDGNEWEVFVVLQDNLPETDMCCVNNNSETISETHAETSSQQCCISHTVLTDIKLETQKSCC